jgi:hypothetical protein
MLSQFHNLHHVENPCTNFIPHTQHGEHLFAFHISISLSCKELTLTLFLNFVSSEEIEKQPLL